MAASSRQKALAAWGVKQDLFKSGLASEIDKGPDYDAALQSPGEVIERGEAIDVGKVAIRPKDKPKPKAQKRDEARISALEAERDQLDQQHAAAVARLEKREADLAREREAEVLAYEKSRGAITAKLKKLRA